MMLRVAVICEFSGRVRDAFLARGHFAMSFDLLPSDSDQGPHYHGDIQNVQMDHWRHYDLAIAFPPCTDLAVSGARYFAEKRADGRQQRAVEFVKWIAALPIPRIAIENPVGVLSTYWRKPDQIINPYEFGHSEAKKTCLWLKGLPLLVPTSQAKCSGLRWDNQTPSGQNKLGPSPDRWKIRSTTYQGIADAMAEQWGNTVETADLFERR